ncbi:MAG: aminopeptidase [Bacteroidaceae bacterium]|nr:aminopeptidase [Bacteroidaceae bacterium]
MKALKYIAIAATLLLSSCQTHEKKNKLYEEGISLELAQLRKQEIKELKYGLSFSIPEQKQEAVEGEARISFLLQRPQEIILDFRESADKIKEVSVNGKPSEYTFLNEHLVLPEASTIEGKNEVHICFTAGDQSLNRNEEYLYTLLVPDRARTVFPCFEQPNLKAEFTLQLEVPAEWEAVSNSSIASEENIDGRKHIAFLPTEPLSTYLFSFVAGKLKKVEYADGERILTAYHRETDAKKVAQLDIIFQQVAASLHWLEEYTDIPYPFAKYSFIILPGFQYGGMEHTGATLYNDTRMFLSEHPTLDEELARAKLIAHETAHMWFGDYVTMDWFNDVWTKEVFANYFAACITEPLFPNVNHSLNWMKTYTSASLAEDRTPGSNSIRQPLDNLRNAGLIYGNIIYNKAPVMMQKLVEIMGEEAYQEGIRKYLKTYAYGNATWDDLIAILDARSEEDLASFSDVWVNQKGMPHISFTNRCGQLEIRQRDPLNRGLLWPQSFQITFQGAEESTSVEVNLTNETYAITVPLGTQAILPNTDGRGYGLFIPDEESREWMLTHWQETSDDTARQSLLMSLYENYQHRLISDREWMEALINGLKSEKNVLIASTLCGYLGTPLSQLGQASWEEEIWEWSEKHPLASCRLQLIRCLISNARAPKSIDKLYQLWKEQSHPMLNERDYMTLAYELALHCPERYENLRNTQRERITNPDRRRQFDFIVQAVTPDTLQMDAFFQSLMKAENRRIEPWAASALAYLNHPLRQSYAVKYIRPGLEVLEEVQRTGDIFFPKNWASALLRNHKSKEAYQEVQAFFEAHPGYSPLLKNKILQAAWPLYREAANSLDM